MPIVTAIGGEIRNARHFLSGGNMPKKLKHIYEQICSFENLYEAYIEARKNKRFRGDVLEFTANLEENLYDIQRELMNKTYHEGEYRKFYVYFPRKRLIMALPFRDRVVQWAFYKVLNPHFIQGYITDSHACINGRGAHSAIARLQYWLRDIQNPKKKRTPCEKWYYQKMDISSFYHRVNHDVICDVCDRKVSDKSVLEFIRNNLDCSTAFGIPPGKMADEVPEDERLFDVGIPIGSLMSQLYANAVLDPVDQFAKRTLGIKYYIRYMDDMLILHNNKRELHEWRFRIEEFIKEELKLDLSKKKTVMLPVSQGIDFVGYKIFKTHIRLRKTTALRMKRRLRLLQREYSEGKSDAKNVREVTASYNGILKHCNSYGLRSKLSESLVFVRR
jgi:hypothetical protein